jgi:hypothetical protein
VCTGSPAAQGISGSCEQGFRPCLGILRLARAFGVARLEAAATRAIEIGALTYGSVRCILDYKLDRHAAHKPARPGSTGTGFRAAYGPHYAREALKRNQ